MKITLKLILIHKNFRFNLLEKDNSGLGDLQKYLKSNKRDLWLPKEQTKEVERGIWSETYLKKLHETLKVFFSKFYSIPRNLTFCFTFSNFVAKNIRSGSCQSAWCMKSQRQPKVQCRLWFKHPMTRLTKPIKARFLYRGLSKVGRYRACCWKAWQSSMKS